MPEPCIDDFVGISNRLETLPLAFAIGRAYGHDVILDRHELDSFSVADGADCLPLSADFAGLDLRRTADRSWL